MRSIISRFLLRYQIHTGLAFNWGALLGWSAVAGSTDWSVCLPLYAGGIAWTLVYDSIYAHQVMSLSPPTSLSILTEPLPRQSINQTQFLQDKTDDLTVGIRSTAILFGTNTRPILTGLSISSLSLISYAGYLNAHGLPFYMGVSAAAIQLARVLYRTDFDSRPSCWSGFVGCGWSGFWVWMGALADYTALMSGMYQ